MGRGTGREIVMIHIGQAGLQIGAAMWELFCQEHNINNQGSALPQTDRAFEMVENLFYETQERKFVPRCIQVDLEPTVMDEIRSGVYRDLYLPSCLINSCPDAANNFARGALTNGTGVMDAVMQAIRKLTNLCDNVSTFKIVHSFTGGTGSGLTSQIVEQLSDTYGKKFKFGIGVYPSTKFSQAMVDPYNTLLMTNSTIDHMDCVCVFDNESLYNIMTGSLGVDGPHFIHINRMMAQMISSITLAHRFRFNDSKHSDLDELLTNLVPFPRIHFPLVSYAPLINWDEQAHMGYSVGELTDACFAPENQTLNVDVLSQKYFSCAMLYRGYMSSKEVYDSLNRVKAYKHIRFVDWCPTGFKVALNMCKPYVNQSSVFASGDRAVCMIAGNACISQAWKRVKTKFDLLYSRRAFVHWYVAEGMEESDFDLAVTMVNQLTDDYNEIAVEVSGGKGTNESNVTKLRGSTLRRMSILKEEKAVAMTEAFRRQSIIDLRCNSNMNFNNFNAESARPLLNDAGSSAKSSVMVTVRPETLPRGGLSSKFGRNRSAAVPTSDGSSEQDSNKPPSQEAVKPQTNLASTQEALFAEAMSLLSNLNLQRLIYSISDKKEGRNEAGAVSPNESGDFTNSGVSKEESVTPLDSNSVDSRYQVPARVSKGVATTEMSETSVTSNSVGSDFALMEYISKNNNCNNFPSPAPRHMIRACKERPTEPRPSPRVSRLRLRSSTGDISNTSSASTPANVLGRPLAMTRLACSVTESVSYVPLNKPPETVRRESVESLFQEETCNSEKMTPRLPRHSRQCSLRQQVAPGDTPIDSESQRKRHHRHHRESPQCSLRQQVAPGDTPIDSESQRRRHHRHHRESPQCSLRPQQVAPGDTPIDSESQRRRHHRHHRESPHAVRQQQQVQLLKALKQQQQQLQKLQQKLQRGDGHRQKRGCANCDQEIIAQEMTK